MTSSSDGESLDVRRSAGISFEANGAASRSRQPGEVAVCRFCGESVIHTFVDLGMSPLCESYLRREQLNQMEPFYPLHAKVCGSCFLVQLEAYVTAEHIFSDYAYFSSYSDSWVEHARTFTSQMIQRLALGLNSYVVELASNDGYLLQHFHSEGIPCLGVEPAANVAQAAVNKGVPTLVRFFGRDLAREMTAAGKQPDLIIGNNVLAQIPDLNDFVAGIKILLAPGGTVTIEFPHLLRTIEGNQFDQVYHEHFSYFSLTTAMRIFAAHQLTVYDVEELPTHGGSIRVYARHDDHESLRVLPAVREMLTREDEAGYNRLETYSAFDRKVQATKHNLLDFLIQAKRQGRSVAGYGAPGKGNTLLNYCGIRADFLDYTVDRSPHKQGKFLPGTHIPIYHPNKIQETKPDYVLILPWNLKTEIMQQMAHIRRWGGRFVVPIPELRIYE